MTSRPPVIAFEVDEDAEVVWVRLPKRVLPIVNRTFFEGGGVLAEDDEREGVDYSFGVSPAVLHSAMAQSVAGVVFYGLFALMSSVIFVASLLFGGGSFDMTAGAAIVFAMMSGYACGRNLALYRAQFRMARAFYLASKS